MERLIELHGLVKNNPYRVNADEKYLKGYRELLHKLSHEFYLEVKETKYRNSYNMCHDFNGSINNVGRTDYDCSEDVAHVERCIGTIHYFIETKTVPYFYTYYKGCNDYQLPRVGKHVFVDDLGKYVMFAKKEEFDKSIKWLENKIKMSEEYVKKHYSSILDGVTRNRDYWYPGG
jgi:hypothetical protein